MGEAADFFGNDGKAFAMFAKKPEPTPAAKSAPGNSLISRIRAIVTKPYVAVGGASILFLAAATGVRARTM